MGADTMQESTLIHEPLILEQPFIGKNINSRFETWTAKANKENIHQRVNSLFDEPGVERLAKKKQDEIIQRLLKNRNSQKIVKTSTL